MFDLSGSTVTYLNDTLPSYDTSVLEGMDRMDHWVNRFQDIKKQIMLMTKSRHNISNIYRDILQGMIASFNDIGYIDPEGKFIEVKCIGASQERAVAKLLSEGNIVLPVISVGQTITTNDDERRRYETILVNEKYYDKDKERAIRILSLAPRAVNILYQVNIWSKYKQDLDQILEQIRLKFNPEMEIPTKTSTICKAYIESEQDIGAVEVADKEDRVLKKQISVVMRTYIPNPKFMLTSTGKIEQFKIDTSL